MSQRNWPCQDTIHESNSELFHSMENAKDKMLEANSKEEVCQFPKAQKRSSLSIRSYMMKRRQALFKLLFIIFL